MEGNQANKNNQPIDTEGSEDSCDKKLYVFG